jgi:hypothetical protein
MDGCGHCDALKPEWEKVEEMCKNKHNIQCIKVERNKIDNVLSKVNSAGGDKIEVQGGYPTIAKKQGGKVSYFEGERTADKIHKWIES